MNPSIENEFELEGDPSSQHTPLRKQRGSTALWILVIASLVLSLIGIAFLRLWLLGWVVGIIALIVSLIGMRRNASGHESSRFGLFASLTAVAFPMIIAAVSFTSAIGGDDALPPRKELSVEFLVETEGDFTVSHNVPPGIGEDVVPIVTAEATDDYSFAFTGTLNSVQFHAGILQSNLGPKEITCTVMIDGEVVLTRTSDQRFVDCSTELQQY